MSPQQLCQAENDKTASFLLELRLTFLYLLWALFIGWASVWQETLLFRLLFPELFNVMTLTGFIMTV